MAAHNWELVRDLTLAEIRLADARRRTNIGPLFTGTTSPEVAKEEAEVQRIMLEIQAGQASCSHIPNPERPERCYKCGFTASQGRLPTPEPAPRPKLARTSPLHVEIKRTA